MLAMSRWYQISLNPLRVLNRTAVKMFLATLCLLQAVYFPVMIIDDTPEKPTLMIMNLLTVWNVTPFGTDEHFVQIEHMVGIILSSLSVTASLLTIWSIFRSQNVPGNLVQHNARRIRSTKKVTLLNAGNVAYMGTLAVLAMFDPYSLEKSILILHRLSTCFLPVLLSTYNPVIYTVLTKGIFNKNSRVRGEH